jgi:DNA polymerase-3 subunit beta
LTAVVNVDCSAEGEVTVPARKLYDICRALPAEAMLEVTAQEGRAVVRSGKSRFTLTTLPASEFPSVEAGRWDVDFTVVEGDLKQVLDRTHFCMAHQDVRYYLNGLLLDVAGKRLRAVATDGHRMGLAETEIGAALTAPRQVIIPRKGVLEMARFLALNSAPVELHLSANHLQVVVGGVTLTSKLIDGRFPDYAQVLPTTPRKVIRAQRIPLREALARVAILANEKYRGARLAFHSGSVVISTHNPEQEEAQEELPISYDGEEVEVGFNVNYIIEALGGLDSEEVEIGINDPNSSCVLQALGDDKTRYIIMPMRL